MLGFAILDVVVGLLLIFLMMSLLCSALREAIEGFMKQRALDLECGIRELLDDPEGDALAREVYEHPLVYGLYTGGYQPIRPGNGSRWFRTGGKLPSYIPTGAFARALVDLDQRGRIQSPAIAGVMRALERGTGGDIEQLRANVETWFEASGERIGGWYRRRTQAILFALGLATAVVFNVNPIVIARTLFQEADLRAAVVATAEGYAAADAAPAQASYEESVRELHVLAAAGIPLGWEHEGAAGAAFPVMLIGWLLTAFAVMLGAPFWFDLLNRFMTVRSTIKPKAGHAPPAVEALPARSPTPAYAPVSEGRSPGTSDFRSPVTDTRGAPPQRSPQPPAPTPVEFRPHAWRDGQEEGLL